MPIICTVIFHFGYLSISALLINEEKHIKILQRKIIHTERENVYFIYSKIERFREFTSECSIESSRIVN